ncbi:hypothetical protein L2E82_22832 [Cichorium intybus]|uniref:Uncharacterized protein n=1 Tax=Cichorium intybus TaxID=13427 RepID=A0ACB9DZ25_CICIN|nr:hypothetical protein L2E82_22832 [Cichorium intybus]
MAKEEAKFSDDFEGGDSSVQKKMKREAILSSSEKAPAVMKISEKQKDWILFGKLGGGYKKDGGLKKRNRGKKSKSKSKAKAKAKAVGSKTDPSKEEDEVEKILDMKSALSDLRSRIKNECKRDRHKEFLEEAKMTVIRVDLYDPQSKEESDESYDYPRHFYCCQKPGSWFPSESELESDSDSIP